MANPVLLCDHCASDAGRKKPALYRWWSAELDVGILLCPECCQEWRSLAHANVIPAPKGVWSLPAQLSAQGGW